MYGRHEHGGWGNQRWGGGGGWGGGPFMGRRVGYPLLGGLGMGGGMGGGGGLVGDLLAGGVGYLMGKNGSQNQQQYQPQYQQAAPQYQQTVPQYQPPVQGSAGGVQDGRLAQLNLLGQLRSQGTLTDDEFQAEKQKILNGY